MAKNQQFKEYSFKAVGQTLSGYNNNTPGFSKEPKPIPIGIRTPIEFGTEYGLFRMHTDALSQVSDNLRNLILTNHGERLGLYDFGANLKSLTTELTNESIIELAMGRISTAVTKYMPYVNLSGFSTFGFEKDAPGVLGVGIRVTFNVPKISTKSKEISITLDTIG